MVHQILEDKMTISECLYVGMTSKSPKERFEQHKSGYRSKKGHKISSSIVEKYGLYLRPSLYASTTRTGTRMSSFYRSGSSPTRSRSSPDMTRSRSGRFNNQIPSRRYFLLTRMDQGVWIHQDAWFHIGSFDSGAETSYKLNRPSNGICAGR